MLKLNILSAELKKEIRHKGLYLSFKDFLSVGVILVCVYCAAFLGFRLLLQDHYDQTVTETTLLTRGADDHGSRIAVINQEIEGLAAIQDESIDWSYLLEFLERSAGQDIRLNQVSLDAKSKRMAISGYSPTRDRLLEFKEAVEAAPFLEEIDFPLKNLLERANINFDISAQFKSYEFNVQ